MDKLVNTANSHYYGYGTNGRTRRQKEEPYDDGGSVSSSGNNDYAVTDLNYWKERNIHPSVYKLLLTVSKQKLQV